MSKILNGAMAVWVTVAVGAYPASAQAPRLVKEASSSEGMGLINTVRELEDGRVLVADPLSRVLQVVDLATGAIEVVGREGRGPAEYLQPDAVYPLAEGRSLLVDLGNARLTELEADLSFGATHPLYAGAPGRDFEPRIPRGVDAQGRVYYQAMVMGPSMRMPTHGTVRRWDLGSGATEDLGQVQLPDREERTTGGPNNQSRSIRQIPLSAADGWAVGPSGAVALVRSGETWRVDWVDGGRTTQGSAMPYEPVRIRAAEKEEWEATRAQSGGGIGISVEMDDQGARTSFARGGAGRDSADDYAWPEHKPAFDPDQILVDGLDRVWVRRHREAGARPLYEVFDASGRKVGDVELEPNRRLVAFGDGTAYVVRFDDMDLQYLERYRVS